VLAVAWWAGRYRPARVLVALGALLGALAFAWLTVEVLTGHLTLIVDFERTTNPIVRGLRGVLPDGRLAPAGTDLLRVVWAIAVLALAAWGVASVRRRDERDALVPVAITGAGEPVARSLVSDLERSSRDNTDKEKTLV
jgi:hypothetical protein